MKFARFTPENSVMLLIDHQVGTMSWVHSIDQAEMQQNAKMLAQTAAIFKMPVVLTSSMEEYAQGPLMPELAEILPEAFAHRVKRLGIVNAMADANFAKEVYKHQCKKIIVAGVTNDVCTVYPVLTLLAEGYDVQVVADAGGSPSKMADDMALRRMEQAGAVLTSTNQLIAELAYDWSTPEGTQIVTEVIMPALHSEE